METVRGSAVGGVPARLFTTAFAIITAAALAYFTSYAVLLPTLPRYVSDALGHGDGPVGIVSGAFAVTALFLRPWVGRVADRRGRRLVMVGGGIAAAASIYGILLVDSLWPLIGLRLLAGVGEAAFFVGAVSAITDIAPEERRGEAMSLFTVSLYSGLAFGPLLGEWTLDERGFNAVWTLGGTLAVAAGMLAAFTRDARPVQLHAAASGARWLHPAGVRAGVVMFTSVIGFAGYTALISLYADDLGMSGSRTIFVMYGLILVAIRLFGRRLPDALGVVRIGRAGLTLSALGLLTMGAIRTMGGLYAGTAIFAAGQALSFPAFMALSASSAPPAERGAAVGTTTAFIDLGFAVGPITLGWIAAATDRPTTFLVSSAVAASGVALQIILTRRDRRLAAESERTSLSSP